MRYLVYSLFVCLFCASCAKPAQESEEVQPVETQIDPEDVMASVNLTVAEGKRLIAVGIAHHPLVQQKMKSGMIIITKGSTNTYIAEELARLDAPRGSFMTGHLSPASKGEVNADLKKYPEIILVDGAPVEMSYTDALKQMKPGDIIFKGGNLLNYDKKQVAVCIGAPDGGTTFKLLPYVGKDKAQLIIPIGLEKQTFGDLADYARVLSSDNQRMNYLPKLYLFQDGIIFTEIEALKTLAKVKVFPQGVGGIAGREGGITLAVVGRQEEVEKILKIIPTIQGEKEFME